MRSTLWRGPSAKKTFSPEDWSAPGTFDFDAAGQRPRDSPVTEKIGCTFLDEAHLTFCHRKGLTARTTLDSASRRDIDVYKRESIASPDLTVEGPWFAGAGRLEMILQQIRFHPEIDY